MEEKKILVTRTSMPPYEEYAEAIKPLWDTHWLTNMGKYHQELERELKEYLGVNGLSLMVNGHMSLELALQALDIPEGSEVITTPFTFISTTHAIVRNRLHPVFCDVKMSDGTIDETKIEELITEKTAAIMPVHVYGHPCNVEAIQEIADKYNLKVIYDAAHTFGVRYKGKGLGSFGDMSCYSFHATKVFNTIEGGAVCFNDPKMEKKLHDLKDFGIRDEEVVASVGANAKMNEFAAVMGLCNLKHIDKYISSRAEVYKEYMERLRNVKGIRFFDENPDATMNYAYFPILVTEESRMTRNEVQKRLKEHNIFSRKYFYPLTSDQACFKNKYKNLPLDNARWLAEHVLVLPMYEGLMEEDVERICALISG